MGVIKGAARSLDFGSYRVLGLASEPNNECSYTSALLPSPKLTSFRVRDSEAAFLGAPMKHGMAWVLPPRNSCIMQRFLLISGGLTDGPAAPNMHAEGTQ